MPLYPPLLEFNGVYSADIRVGVQTFRVGIDSGSADTWLLTSDTNCTALGTLEPVTPDLCGYSGPRYTPDEAFKVIPDVNFNETYGTGETLNGPVGYTELIFGGLTVPKQAISAASYASVGNDPVGNVSGLVGIVAYPKDTTVYPGTDPKKDITCSGNSSCGPVPYSPLFSTIFNDNLTKPLFATALSRGKVSGGVLTIGGIPHKDDPYVNVTDVVATVPIEPYTNTTFLLNYFIGVDEMQYTGAPSNAGQGRYIVDTGTSANTFPAAQAAAINALYSPPAVLNKTINLYTVPCNATVPQLGIKIGGQVFNHNPQDMIVKSPAIDGLCYSAIQTSLATLVLPILGATFLKNVLAVFDVGKSEMTFMSRMYYES